MMLNSHGLVVFWKPLRIEKNTGQMLPAVCSFSFVEFILTTSSKNWKAKSPTGLKLLWIYTFKRTELGRKQDEAMTLISSALSCSFQPEGRIYSLLGSLLACLFVLGSRLRDEQSFHADSDGIKPSSPGQWHPDVLPVDSRSHHFSHRCQRSPIFPNKPQVNQAGGGGADGDGPDDVFGGGSRSLHAAGSKVGHQAAVGLPCSSGGVQLHESGEPSS